MVDLLHRVRWEGGARQLLAGGQAQELDLLVARRRVDDVAEDGRLIRDLLAAVGLEAENRSGVSGAPDTS